LSREAPSRPALRGLAWAGLALGAPVQEEPARAALGFELDAAPFAGVPTPPVGEAFTVLAADADADGDPDLFVNWHIFAAPALLWNEAGRFGTDGRGWSLPELRAAPRIDGPRREILDGIARRSETGVYLWHSDRGRAWLLALQGPFADGATLVIESNRPIGLVQGGRADTYERVGERVLRIPLRAEGLERALFATEDMGMQVRARVEGGAVPIFVGPEFTRNDAEVELWGRDPHGVTWVDAAGDSLPDLVLVRGALRGQLGPPFDGKFDDFFVAGRGERVGYGRHELPRSYGRGRAVQWVDLEGDGRLELHVGNKNSPNALFAFEAAPLGAVDRAPALGLDLLRADAFAWADLDGDGVEELLTLDASAGLGLYAWEPDARRFVPRDAPARGLALPPLGGTDEEGAESEEALADTASRGIDQHDLLLFDADSDGDLDLLVTGWGSAGACRFFRARADGFEDATEEVGLGGALGVTQALVCDFDADAWFDLWLLGGGSALYRNERGCFRSTRLAEDLRRASRGVGSTCDVDGDGRIDVVLAHSGLAVARNRCEPRAAWITVTLGGPGRVPLGARVRAFHADGAVVAVRAGSFHRGHLAQGFGPILLATPAANPIRRLEVRFPAGAVVTRDVTGPGPLHLAPD
jgi:hypothetical protein